jgi:transcriptional regulator with XRE-family HTH domain
MGVVMDCQRSIESMLDLKMNTIYSKRHKWLIEFIITYRKRVGISQVQLAKKLKKSQTWISRIESGQRRIEVTELLDLGEAIGFDTPTLVAAVQKSGPGAVEAAAGA